MDKEKILELASRWGVLYGDVRHGNWRFTEKELLSFAQSILEADRKELVKTIMPKLIELAFLSGRNNSPVSKNEHDGILKELLKVWL